MMMIHRRNSTHNDKTAPVTTTTTAASTTTTTTTDQQHRSYRHHGRNKSWERIHVVFKDLSIMVLIHYLVIKPYILHRYNDSSMSIQQQQQHVKWGQKRRTKIISRSERMTDAARREQSLHDRILVHAMYLTRTLEPWTGFLMDQHDREENNKRLHQQDQKQIFIGLLMNPTRAIPYVNAFIISYLWNLVKDPSMWVNDTTFQEFMMNRNHQQEEEEEEEQKDILQIHLFDTNRLTSKSMTDIYRFIMLHLPFLQYHVPSISTTDDDNNNNNLRCHSIQYYLKAIQACIDSSLSYCILVHESTVLPTYFTSILKDWILQEARANQTSIWNREIISLFSMIQRTNTHDDKNNNKTIPSFRVLDLLDQNYSSSILYKYDQALLNSQRKHLNISSYQPSFMVYSSRFDVDDPTPIQARNIALWIPRIKGIQDVVPFLIHSQSTSSCLSNHHHNMDDNHYLHASLDLEYELALYTKNQRYHVEPSLINHIGDERYDGHSRYDDDEEEEWMMITDPRFLLDPGLYQQGLDFYCKDETDGLWYMYDEPVDCSYLESK